MKVAVIKYNAGNIRSVSFALERLGVDFALTENKEEIKSADKVIFPGVGEASSTMRFLKERKLDTLIRELRQPTLGICLGMQLMCHHSEENDTACLGIFEEEVKRFESDTLKIPHMGWNALEKVTGWLPRTLESQYVYFVHSYYVPASTHTVAQTNYGIRFSAAMKRDNFYAVQFHPEKSAEAGSMVLESFLVNRDMRIIPAIDIVGGKCVRLTQGDYGKMKVYREDPVEVAKEFEEADLEYLHLVDLDGAKKGRVVNWRVIEKIQAETALKVDFGGGVKTEQEVEELLELGIEQINIGSLAVREPDTFSSFIRKFGSENFILSADVKLEKIQLSGWTEASPLSIYDLTAQFQKDGLKYVTCTDIQADGMLQGPNFGLYKKLKNRFPDLKIIASGGISSMDDLEELKYIKVHGAIIGKALYEHKISFAELKNI